MAQGAFFNIGLRRLIGGAPGAISWTADPSIKIMMLTAGTPYILNLDHQYVSDLVASEAAGTGYIGGFGGAGRKALTGRTVDDDLTADRTLFKADPLITWPGLALSTGAITQLVVFKENGADATSPLICLLDPVDLVTNGGDVSLNFPNGEVAHIQQIIS